MLAFGVAASMIALSFVGYRLMLGPTPAPGRAIVTADIGGRHAGRPDAARSPPAGARAAPAPVGASPAAPSPPPAAEAASPTASRPPRPRSGCFRRLTRAGRPAAP